MRWPGDRQSKLQQLLANEIIQWRWRLTRASIIDRGEVDIITPDKSHVVSTNIDLKIWKLGVAREGHASDGLVVDCTGDLAVVSVDNGGVGQHESGSGVSDSLATSNGHGSSRADLELGG